MVADRHIREPHLRMEEAELEAGVGLRTGRDMKALEQHFVANLEDMLLRYQVLRHRHSVLRRSDGGRIARISVVAYRSHTGEGEIGTELNSDGCLNTHVAFVNLRQSLVDEGTSLVVIVTVELRSVPTLGEESRHTTADNWVVELVGQVAGNHFLAGGIELLEIRRFVVNIDFIQHAVVDTLRDIGIACVRSACLCQRIQFQAVTTVNLVNHTGFESGLYEMVGVTVVERANGLVLLRVVA